MDRASLCSCIERLPNDWAALLLLRGCSERLSMDWAALVAGGATCSGGFGLLECELGLLLEILLGLSLLLLLLCFFLCFLCLCLWP